MLVLSNIGLVHDSTLWVVLADFFGLVPFFALNAFGFYALFFSKESVFLIHAVFIFQAVVSICIISFFLAFIYHF